MDRQSVPAALDLVLRAAHPGWISKIGVYSSLAGIVTNISHTP